MNAFYYKTSKTNNNIAVTATELQRDKIICGQTTQLWVDPKKRINVSVGQPGKLWQQIFYDV